jgi:hypothetical protein
MEIFRFQKLPVELRYRIYDFTLLSSKPLHATPNPDKKLGFALLRTCRQIYEEASPFFYRNNFKIVDPIKSLKGSWDVLRQNIKEVTFEWWGFALKDPATLRALAKCPKLKLLNINLTQYCVGGDTRHHKRQYQHQDKDSIKKFSRTQGFDALAEFRGLEKVTVSNPTGPFTAPAKEVSNEEIAALEAFLMKTLTKPKPQPTVSRSWSTCVVL